MIQHLLKSIVGQFFIRSISIVIALVSFLSFSYAQLSTFDNTSAAITQDLSKAIDSKNITNPLRDGTRFAIESPDKSHILNVINGTTIVGFEQAQNQTLQLIHNIINILLSFTALIVLIYLIFEGYMIVTAGTDEAQYKKALGKLKNAAIAIAGIAVSRFIVSFIFAALNTII